MKCEVFKYLGKPIFIKWREDDVFDNWEWFNLLSIGKNKKKITVIGIPDPVYGGVWEGESAFKIAIKEIAEIMSYEEGIAFVNHQRNLKG